MSEYCVIFFHGYGANGVNMDPMVDAFENFFTEFDVNVECFAPDGILEHSDSHGSHMWYSLTSLDHDVVQEGIHESFNEIQNYIDRASQGRKTFLVGFSQGGHVALHMALHSGLHNIVGAISFSGFLPPITERIYPDRQLLLVHGNADQVVPLQTFQDTISHLISKGVPFQAHLVPDTEHHMCERGLFIAELFIGQALTELEYDDEADDQDSDIDDDD
jgi:phospholipase/carboxylesterase